MTDESKTAPDDAPAGPLAGERLGEARRARDIPLDDISRELHVDDAKVRALEKNEFDKLGAPVFAQGYLRKYATLVGIPADEVLAEYRRFVPETGVLPILGPRRKQPREISPGPWLAGIFTIAVIAGGAWLWTSGTLDPIFSEREPTELAPFAIDVTPDGASEAAAPQAVADAGEPLSQDAAAGETEPGTAPPGPDNDAGPETNAGNVAVPVGDQVSLTLSFSGDCWTEVSDGAGERLYFGLGTAGGSVSVSGAPPLHVLLGDSDHAVVAVDGEDFPIPPSARRGETARLTITGR